MSFLGITEKKWLGTFENVVSVTNGILTLSTAYGFYPNQVIQLTAIGQPLLQGSVRRLIGPTQITIGPLETSFGKTFSQAELALYAGGTIVSNEQDRSSIGQDVVIRAAYSESAIALRNLLVDKFSTPIDSVTRVDGTTALAVDATVSVVVPPVTVDLDALTPPTQLDPDNVLIAGSEDGTKTGLKRAVRVKPDGTLYTEDIASVAALNAIELLLTNGIQVDDDQTQVLITASNTLLAAIETQLTLGTIKVDDEQSQVLLTDILTRLVSGGLQIGTEDGTPTGIQHVFVNNFRKMILDSHDRQSTVDWLDIASKKNRRADKIMYTSATFVGVTLVKEFQYTLSGGDYVPSTVGNWSII